MKWLSRPLEIAVFTAIVALCLSGQTKKPAHLLRAKASLIDFVNPGLVITINSAKISSAGVISVTYTLADPNGYAVSA